MEHVARRLRERTRRRQDVVEHTARYENILFSRERVDLRGGGLTIWLVSWPLARSFSRVRLVVDGGAGAARVRAAYAGFLDDSLVLDPRLAVPFPGQTWRAISDDPREYPSVLVAQSTIVYASDPESVLDVDRARARTMSRTADLVSCLPPAAGDPRFPGYLSGSDFSQDAPWIPPGAGGPARWSSHAGPDLLGVGPSLRHPGGRVTWGEIRRRCPQCKKLRRKVRDRRPERHWKYVDGALVCHLCAQRAACKTLATFLSREQALQGRPLDAAYLCSACGRWHIRRSV